MAKDRRSRDQKRRDKLAKKNRRTHKPESLAYMGAKYKTEKLVQTWLSTEIGIHESYEITDRTLTDQTVVAAVEELIKRLRTGTLPPLTNAGEIDYQVGQEVELVIMFIRCSWECRLDEGMRPPKEKLVGVLRSILGSIESVRTPGPRSQGYMHHITEFLTKKLGVSVKQVSVDMKPTMAESEEDELVRPG